MLMFKNNQCFKRADTGHVIVMRSGSAVTSQARTLESILLGGAKKILGCSFRTCNETVRGDRGLETLKSQRQG